MADASPTGLNVTKSIGGFKEALTGGGARANRFKVTMTFLLTLMVQEMQVQQWNFYVLQHNFLAKL